MLSRSRSNQTRVRSGRSHEIRSRMVGRMHPRRVTDSLAESLGESPLWPTAAIFTSAVLYADLPQPLHRRPVRRRVRRRAVAGAGADDAGAGGTPRNGP